MSVVFFHPPVPDGWMERRGWTGCRVPAPGDGASLRERERERRMDGWMDEEVKADERGFVWKRAS